MFINEAAETLCLQPVLPFHKPPTAPASVKPQATESQSLILNSTHIAFPLFSPAPQ